MVQSDRETFSLEIGTVIRKLLESADLEGRVLEDSQYSDGRVDAYHTVYSLLQQISGLERDEFDRKIDEQSVVRALGLNNLSDGKYEIAYMDGRITLLNSAK